MSSYWNTKRLQILPSGEWVVPSLRVKMPTKPKFYLILLSLNWGHNFILQKSANLNLWLFSYFEGLYMQNNHFLLLKIINGLKLIHLRYWKAYYDLTLILTSKSEVIWQNEHEENIKTFFSWTYWILFVILHHSCEYKSCYQKSKASVYQISLNYINPFQSYNCSNLTSDFQNIKWAQGKSTYNFLYR